MRDLRKEVRETRTTKKHGGGWELQQRAVATTKRRSKEVSPMRSGARIVLALIIASLLGAGAFAETVKNPDVFVEASSNSVDTMDPQFISPKSTQVLLENIYDGLLEHSYEQPELVVPGLATIVPSVQNGLITLADDGSMYVSLPIRTGVKFHNGAVLTPEDVEYTIERGILVGGARNMEAELVGDSFANRVAAIGYDAAFDELDGAVQVEGNTVMLRLVQPNVIFNDLITGPQGRVFNKAWCIEQGCWPGTKETGEAYMELTQQDDPLFDKAMGTGPFMLTSWEPMERVILDAFEDYWRGAPTLKRATREIVDDAQTQILMLQNGDADFISLGVTNLPLVEGVEGITVLKNLASPFLRKINMNWDIAPNSPYIGNGELGPDGIPTDFFSDIDVRKAFAYSYDWDTFIDEVLLGAGAKPYGPVPIGFPTANPDNPQYSLDLEKAEEHFRAAWGGEVWEKGFHFTVPSPDPNRTASLQILIDNIESLNPEFNIEISQVPWATYVTANVQHVLPIMLYGMLSSAVDPYPNIAFDMWSKDAYADWNGYIEHAAEHYDALVEELASSFDPERRQEVSYELQRLAYEWCHTIYEYQVVNHVAMRDWVQGYIPGLYPSFITFYNLSKAY